MLDRIDSALDPDAPTTRAARDAKGVPATVTLAERRGVFQHGARSAILRCRAGPLASRGETVSVRTTIRIRYVLEE